MDVPDDIRHKAFVALEDWYRRTPDDVANAVARAILAERLSATEIERERCTKLVLSAVGVEYTTDVSGEIAKLVAAIRSQP